MDGNEVTRAQRIAALLVSLLLVGVGVTASTAAQAQNVLILGTSTTEGMGASPIEKRYATLVTNELQGATVTTFGRGGTTLADPATPNWLNYSVPSGYNVVVLQFGFNEWNRGTPATTFKPWAVDFMTRVRAANPGVRLVWLSPWIGQYLTPAPDVRAHGWQEYGMAIESALRTVGGNTAHVDLDPTGSRRLAAPYSLGAADGLHYNNRGHRAIADALLATLRN